MNEKNNKDELALLHGCLKGKPSAQEKLFKKYYSLMLGICYRYAYNKSDARDILQEGFVKIFNNIHGFKGDGSFVGWMKRIMVNTAIDKYRKNISQPTNTDLNENLDLQVTEDIYSKMNKEDLLNCIEQLPLGYRTVFNMYVIEGYSHKEIADLLGINEGTSKSQLFKAKQQLKQMISELF